MTPHDDSQDPAPPVSEEPTVVRHPWRATIRTTLVALVALLPLLPDIAEAAHIDTVPVVVGALGIAATVQRVLALPSVEHWLRTWTRFTSAEPPPTTPPGRHRKDT